MSGWTSEYVAVRMAGRLDGSVDVTYWTSGYRSGWTRGYVYGWTEIKM